MTTEEILDSIRALWKSNFLQIVDKVEDIKDDFDSLFFRNFPDGAIKYRNQAAKLDNISNCWFLVTDHPRGSEYTDNLQLLGVFIVVIDDPDAIRKELETMEIDQK